MQRVLVYSRGDEPLFELSTLEVYGLNRKETINSEHSMTIKTTRVLQRGQRVLTLDNRGRWHEHVVYGTDESHESGSRPIGQYYCVWSLMHDLMGTTVSRMVGTQTPVLAELGLEAALSGTSRWQVGTVTNSNLAGASMYDMGGWEAMQVLTENWGGEIDVTIEVGLAGVVSRKVDYYDAQGEHEAKRRFDFGADLKSVRRKVPDGPIFCRISPRGKGEQTEDGGYGRKITIESVNNGIKWLQNDALAQVVRMPDGNGGWEYPTRIVENSQIDSPSELKAWGLSVLDDYTLPKVSYEVDAVQAATEGVDVQGVSLGDVVHVVDAKFGGLRVGARVTSIETDMLDELSVKVKLGHIGGNIGDTITELRGSMASIKSAVNAVKAGTEMTDSYLQRLVARLNDEINATGGYVYITEGDGIRTYDTAVSDPLVGAEASKVVEVKGGTIRIADSKTAQGEWEWDTVFVSGHVAAQLVTAANLTAGYIGNASTGSFWNLDTGELRISSTTRMGSKTVQQILDGVDSTVTDVDVEYAQNASPTTAPTTGWGTTAPSYEQGKYIWSRTKTTTAAGATYSTPVMISGRDGVDGTNGTDGRDGIGISATAISYGVSNSAASQPSTWSQTAPTSIANGKWLWSRTVMTYTDGTDRTTYSKSYVGTNGQNGQDGTSVTILGSYDTLAQLQAAHPTGSVGDSYIVAGDLYVWNGSSWEDVGQIQGPQGERGTDGTSVTVSSIQYGISDNESSQPASWGDSVPSPISKGSWLWVRTTYSDSSTATTKSYVGTDGEDGASVHIQSATKSGDTTTVVLSDGTTQTTLSIVDGEDGANGTNGAAGYVHTAWANSADGATDFSTTVSTNKKYLGVYTDNTSADSTNPSAYSWSLIKGSDGKSVSVQSTTKSGDTTTVVLAETNPATGQTTTRTLTIKDGEDGENGQAGANGYVHVAWATSADGTQGFSTTVSEGKTYIGVYTDNVAADSTSPSAYSWSRIQGDAGEDGLGIASIVEQYYLSTSSSSVTGGSWVTTPPTYVSGRYYWTRSQVTWDDGAVTTTTPVLSQGLNSANSNAARAQQSASDAARVATDYLTFTQGTGLDVGYSGTQAKTRVSTSGLEVFDGNGNSALFAGLSGSKSLVRVGRESNSGNVIMSSDGYVDVRNATTVMAHFGYGSGKNSSGGMSVAPYYDVGVRKSATTVGNYSMAEGFGNEASGYVSHAEGVDTVASGTVSHAEGSSTTASGMYSHVEGYQTNADNDFSHSEGGFTTASGYASHAEGSSTEASGEYSHAEGSSTKASGNRSHAEGGGTTASGASSHAEGGGTTASGAYSHAEGWNTIASGDYSHAGGKYNVSNSSHLLSMGNGTNGSLRSDAMYLTTTGNLWIKGTLTQNSDRRLKEHHTYLSDDACDFIRRLRPALYTKDGERHTGFYAQDVREAEPDGWDTVTVASEHTDESLDFDPLTLNYSALIAPLVAYCQHLERRIDALEQEVK